MTTVADAHTAMRGKPFETLQAVIGDRPPMILAPHPDDEVLGYGGLIVQTLAAGMAPVVEIVTDGSRSYPRSRRVPPPVLKTVREAKARQAATILGMPLCRLHFFRYRDAAAPHDGPEFEDAVARIVALATASGSGAIFAPWRMDPHCDHLAVHKMAAAAAQITGLRQLSYPIWGWLLREREELGVSISFGHRLCIETQLDRKRRALRAHASHFGRVVDDDPSGFELMPDLLATLLQPFEVFLENR